MIFVPIALGLMSLSGLGLYLTRSKTVQPGQPGSAISQAEGDQLSQELAAHPDLREKVIQLIQDGQDPDAMDAFANELSADGFTFAPNLLHQRASQLRAAHHGVVLPAQPQVQPAPPATNPNMPPKPPAGGTMGVLAVQKALNVLGYGPLAEDGAMGPLTKSAIMKFQQSHGLSVDGIVGPQTSAALQAALMNAPPSGSPSVPTQGGTMSILSAQKALNVLGYGPLAEDGVTGPMTKASVTKFQKDHGLSADGIVGPQTTAALAAALSTPAAQAQPAPANTQFAVNSVLSAQKALNQLGYGPLAEDGSNGPMTKAAVTKFQRDHGLTVDGLLGPQTYGALQKALG